MDKNTIIGFLLIFAIVIAWQQFMKPSAAEIAEQRLQDSLRMEQGRLDSLAQLPTAEVESPLPDAQVEETAAADDSLAQVRFAASFGPFAPAAQGEEKEYVLENELLKLVISSKGGRIVEAELKQYKKIREGEKNKEIEEPLLLLEDEKNRFEYLLPVAGLPAGLSTADLYFSAETGDNTLTLRAPTTTGAYFEQTYSLEPGTYHVDYVLNWQGLENVLDRQQSTFELNWLNYLDKLEKNTSYERNYSTVYFKPVEESVEHCSCTGTDQEQVDDQRLKWVSNTNQFFNSTLIAETGFQSGSFETEVLDLEADDLKKLHSRLAVPYGESTSFDMDFYIGPNEFERLASYGLDLQDVVPFGRSIFGTVNRWVIRPIFSFLSKFIGSKGIVILMLTLIVKLLLYPLTYRMLYSQSKMGALKPHLANLKEKFKDDPQKQQMETMKIYQEFGVNPLGGCLPVVAQMPIWFALYRFFPASIEFRQESFLWATDLSSYDVAFSLPTEIPFYGDHVSMFTILWAITTVIYTYYNTRHMDMSVNPAMKYMQYFMPIMFLFFFNSFASGLTCYLLFSNLLNITQTIVTKNYLIDNDKLSRELEAYRSKPKKKKKGFQARLEAALKEQQRQQAERDTKNKKKKGN